MKQFLALIVCLAALTVSAQETQIRKGGGGAGGSATNAVATIRKDGTPVVNGATIIDFTNAAGSVVTVTADGTTARVGIPQGGGGGSLVTNANQFGASTDLTIKDGVLLTNATIATAVVSGSLNSQGDTTLSGSSGITANRAMYLDISKKIQTSANVSSTELEYLDGVSSALQPQLDGKQTGSMLASNFFLMGISNIASANANIVLTTNTGVLVLTGSGSGGGGGTNYDTIIVTNVIQRQVLWTTTTNLTVDWNGPDEIIWAPTGVTASLAFTGNPGNLTNAVSKILKLRLTDAGTTTITWPTNGIDGLAPKTLTPPSTNEYLLKYDGQIARVDSFQSFSTGSGEVIVVNTNPVIYTPTVRYVPTVVTGVGGANTNFTLISTQPEVSINGFTNVSIRAAMGYDAAAVDYWTCIITNGSGSARTLEFSAVTNNWRFSGVYGTNAPNTLTNATRLEISGRQHGTNVQVFYGYTPWP